MLPVLPLLLYSPPNLARLGKVVEDLGLLELEFSKVLPINRILMVTLSYLVDQLSIKHCLVLVRLEACFRATLRYVGQPTNPVVVRCVLKLGGPLDLVQEAGLL